MTFGYGMDCLFVCYWGCLVFGVVFLFSEMVFDGKMVVWKENKNTYGVYVTFTLHLHKQSYQWINV